MWGKGERREGIDDWVFPGSLCSGGQHARTPASPGNMADGAEYLVGHHGLVAMAASVYVLRTVIAGYIRICRDDVRNDGWL